LSGSHPAGGGPLQGVRVVSLAVNAPGPVAVARLRDLGAAVTKIEPPTGDPLARLAPDWYAELIGGVRVETANLGSATGRDRFDLLLADADVLVTAQRPAALARLGLEPASVAARHPQLAWAAIVGHAPPNDGIAGHDLTYLARYGLVDPPQLPRTLAADLLGAERTVSAVLAMLLGGARFSVVALDYAAAALAVPLRHGLTTPDGILGGAFGGYGVYPARDGWVAVAALEQRFQERLQVLLDLPDLTPAAVAAAIGTRTVAEWVTLGAERDIPLVAITTPHQAG
jgi:alpha-methylacyl-CoA racemase